MSYKPEFPFLDDQLIFNSNRISLNSKTDSIFLFSNKAIGLSSNEGIHLNTDKEIILNSSKTFIGLNADEPLLKGNKTEDLLTKILDELITLGDILSNAKDSNNNPIVSVQTAGDGLIKSINRIKKILPNIKSDKNFTN